MVFELFFSDSVRSIYQTDFRSIWRADLSQKPLNSNLKTILTLKDKFKCNVGYSGHETGLAISYAAAALGVSSIERHITINRAMYGSDQAASLAPAGIRKLVPEVRKIERALGDH